MADTTRDDNPQERPGATSETEREEMESEHGSGDDTAVTGRGNEERFESQDVDPDSADAEVDRDDTIDEI
jgi:hypothetical protein